MFLIIAVLAAPFSAFAAMTAVSVVADDNTVGAQTMYVINFTTSNGGPFDWPADGKLTVEFPANFGFSSFIIASGIIGVDGGLTALGAGTTVTISRDGTGSIVAGGTAVQIRIANVINYTIPGTIYQATVTTLDGASAPIEVATSSDFSLVLGSLNYFTMTGVPGSLTAGAAFSTDVTVTAYDANNNIITDYTGDVYFTSTDGSVVLPYTTGSRYTYLPGDNGSKTFAGTGFTLKTDGAHTITVTDGSISQESGAIDVNAGPIADFTLTAGVTQTAGASFSLSVSNAVDSEGNLTSGTVVVSAQSGGGNSPDGTSPTLSNITVSNGSGSASQTLVKTEATVLRGVSTVTRTTGSITVNPGSISEYTLSGNPSSVIAGSSFGGANVIVNVYDTFGNLKTDYTGDVYFTSTDGSAVLPYTTGSRYTYLPGDNGSKTFAGTGFILKTEGAQTITVTDASISQESGAVVVNAGPIADFTLTAGATQTAGASFSMSVTNAVDSEGNLTSGTVVVSAQSGGGNSPDGTSPTLSNITVSNGSGSASQTLVKTEATVLRGVSTVTRTTGSITVNPGSISEYTLSGNPSSVIAGSSFGGANVIVNVYDTFGNLKTDYIGDVYFTSTDGSAVLPYTTGSRYTYLLGDSGSKTFLGTGFTLKTEGAQTITVTDASISQESGAVVVNAGPIVDFTLTAGATQTAGASFSMSVTNAVDSEGNLTSGTVVVSAQSGGGNSPDGTSPTLSNITVSNGSGSASQTLVKTVATVLRGVSTVTRTTGSITINPGSISEYTLSGNPSSVIAGSSFGGANVIVNVYDTFGNLKTDYIGDVYFTSTDGSAVLPYTTGSRYTYLLGDSGSKTFLGTGFTLNTEGAQTITVSNGSISQVSSAIDVSTSGLKSFILTVSGGLTQTAGVAFSLQVSNAVDSSDNAWSGTLNTAVFTGGGNSPNGSSPSINSITVVNGNGYSNQTLVNAVTTELRVYLGLIEKKTGSMTLNPGSLSSYTLSGNPSSVIAGSSFGGANVIVNVYDTFGNLKTDYIGDVYFTSTDGSAVLPYTFGSEYTYLPGDNGSKTFVGTGFTLNTEGAQTITVSNGSISQVSSAIDVSTSGLKSFILTVSGGLTQTAGAAFSLQVSNAVDSSDNAWSGTLNTAVFTGGGNSPNGSSPSINSITVVNGNGSSNQTLVNAVTTNLRVFLGTIQGTTGNITVNPDVLSTFQVAADSNATPFVNQTAGQLFNIGVVAKDAYNNTIRTFTGTTVLSDLSSSLDTTSGSFVKGVWTGQVRITGSKLANTITATDAGKNGTSNSFNVNPAALDHFLFDPVSSPQVAGTGFPVTITALDLYENIVTGFTGAGSTANLTVNTGLATWTPSTTTGGFTAGLWTGTVTVTKTLTNVQITAQSGIVSDLSNSFNIIPAVISKVIIRDAALGSGSPVDDRSLTLDQTLRMYAAGYDQYDNFSHDVNVIWSTTGNLDAPNPLTGTFTDFNPSTPNTSGKITADSSTLSDSTGIITVGSIFSIKIRDGANGQGNEITNLTLTADDSTTLFAAGYDASSSFIGDVMVDWSSSGLVPSVSVLSVASITFSPTTASPGTITAQHPTAGTKIANITVNPGVPVGTIALTPTPSALPADGSSTAAIVSNIIRDSDGNIVNTGTLITVSTTEGTITTPDASAGFAGRQVATNPGGIISFVLQSGSVGGTAIITATSVSGSASGLISVPILNFKILSIEAPDTVSQGQISASVTMNVQNLSDEPITSVDANLTFTGPGPGFITYNGDYTNKNRTLPSIPANSTTPIEFPINVIANANIGIPITIDGNITGLISATPVAQPNAEITDSWIVQVPAQLQILEVATTFSDVSQGQQNIPFTMTVKNNGEARALITNQDLRFFKGANNVSGQYSVFPDPTNPATIDGDSTRTFNFVVNVAAGAETGAIVLDGEISATDVNSSAVITDIGADITDSWNVIEAAVLQIISLVPQSPTATQNQSSPWYVDLTVKNNGQAPVSFDSAKISIFIGSEVTQEYTIPVPTEFYNNGIGSNTLSAGSTDKVRFIIDQTGGTTGLANIQGQLWVTDQVSQQPLTGESSGSVRVQTPANLSVNFILIDDPVTVGQENYIVSVNIQNNGESSILIDTTITSSNLVFKIGATTLTDFIIAQPVGINNLPGVFELAGGQNASLFFLVVKTSLSSGSCFLTATIGGSEINSGRNVSAPGFKSFSIVQPSAVYLQSTNLVANHQTDVNAGQTFTVEAIVSNNGGENVTNVNVALQSDDASIFNSPVTIPRIVSGNTGIASFTIVASANIDSTEIFTAQIVSAISENTSQPVSIGAAADSLATAIIRKPAGLQILSVVPSQAEVMAGQASPRTWDIYVIVSDTGYADLEFTSISANNIVFTKAGDVQTGYIVDPPDSLQGGGWILRGGESDTLVYTVLTTGPLSGDIVITANLNAVDQNDLRTLPESGAGNVVVNTAAEVTIARTVFLGPPKGTPNPYNVNINQNFYINVQVENLGTEEVVDVFLSLSTNGGSQILDSSLQISSILVGSSAFLDFEVKADSLVNLSGETFSFKIDSAKSAVSQSDAIIKPSTSNTARIFIDTPAKAQLDLTLSDPDNILTAGSDFEVNVNLINRGGSDFKDEGTLELIIPENYLKITLTDTSYVPRDTVNISQTNPVLIKLLAPASSQGPDTLFAIWITPPQDENTDSLAIVYAPGDSVEIATIGLTDIVSSIEIISPQGSTDGTISTEQEFILRATGTASKNLNNMQATLVLPDNNYTTTDLITQPVEPDSAIWIIRSPQNADQVPKNLIVKFRAEDDDGIIFNNVPDTLQIETVRRADLSVNASISSPPGAINGVLSKGQQFTIQAYVANNGQAAVNGTAELRLDLGTTNISVVENLIRPFTFDPGSSTSVSVEWTATAPDSDISLLPVTVSIETAPNDENTDAQAQVGKRQHQFNVSTEETAQLTNSLEITSPDGAKDGVISTGQDFTVTATINSVNSSNVLARLILPAAANFFVENATISVTPGGTDEVSWIVRELGTPIQDAKLKIITTALDRNSNLPIESLPDSIFVTVREKATLQIVATVPKSIVSISEEFVITATINNAGDAQVSDEAELTLSLPPGFSTSAEMVQETSLLIATWRVKAPDVPSSIAQNIPISITRAPLDENTEQPAFVDVKIASVNINVAELQLEISKLENFGNQAVAKGDKNVPVFGLNFRNRGNAGSNPIHLNGLNLHVKDANGNLVSPQSVFSKITIRNVPDTTTVYSSISGLGLPSENPMALQFLSPLVLNSGDPVLSLGVYADILPSANGSTFYISFSNNNDVNAVDGITGQKVTLVNQVGTPIANVNIASDNMVIIEASFNTSFGNFPNPFGRSGRLTTKFVYYLETDTDIEFRIYTITGDLVLERKFLATDQAGQRGLRTDEISWDGRNGNGNPVLNGVYIAVLSTANGKQAVAKVAYVK